MINLKPFFIGVFTFLILSFFSCEKNDDTITQQDTSLKSYTGVLIGSTGAYKIDLKDSGTNASVFFDNVNYSLSSNEKLQNGQSLTLTDGKISLIISIDNLGNNPKVSFTIPGHNIQSTIVVSKTTNPNRNYIGWTENTRNGIKIYKTTFNLTLQDGGKWTGIERVDYDINPNDPNHVSTAGVVRYNSGTFTENSTGVNFTSLFQLKKVANKLTLFNNGTPETFEVELTKVN